MNATRRNTGLAVAVVAMVLAACGGGSGDDGEGRSSSEGDERSDDGEIFVQTEEGDVAVDGDGNVVVVGEDGEVVTGEVDADDGSVEIRTDGGDGGGGSVQIDDGGIEVSGGDDGGMTFETGEDFPDAWPADVPRPPGLTVTTASAFTEGDELGVTVNGTVDGDLAAFASEYGAELEAAGLSETASAVSGGSVTALHENQTYVVATTGSSVDGTNQVSVSVSTGAGGN